MNTNEIILIYTSKLLLLAANFLIVNICANFTSQVYMDKVLINQENPPKLDNYVSLFLILSLLVMLIIGIAIYGAISFLSKNDKGMFKIIKLLAVDFTIYLLFMILLGYMISGVMYSKKFFMYKDDGLRAIRALKDLILKLSLLFVLMPFFLITNISFDKIDTVQPVTKK